MKTTTVTLTIQWDPMVHRDPATWDLRELIDPDGEHSVETSSITTGTSCDAGLMKRCGKTNARKCECCGLFLCLQHESHGHVWEMT